MKCKTFCSPDKPHHGLSTLYHSGTINIRFILLYGAYKLIYNNMILQIIYHIVSYTLSCSLVGYNCVAKKARNILYVYGNVYVEHGFYMGEENCA